MGIGDYPGNEIRYLCKSAWGKDFFDANKYKKANIELEFLTQEIQKYNQRIREFVPGLSILDVMMFCTPEEIRSMMDSYKIEKGE